MAARVLLLERDRELDDGAFCGSEAGKSTAGPGRSLSVGGVGPGLSLRVQRSRNVESPRVKCFEFCRWCAIDRKMLWQCTIGESMRDIVVFTVMSTSIEPWLAGRQPSSAAGCSR